MPNDEKIFLNRLRDLSDRAYFGGYSTYSDFLNINEQSLLLNERFAVGVTLFGGYSLAERKVARFSVGEECSDFSDFAIKIVCVSPLNMKFSDNLNHRDFLGSLMGLGISRSMIGDIIVADNCGYIFCLEKISALIAQELKKVKHTSVKCSIISELPSDISLSGTDNEVIVPSLRLDAVAAAVFSMSRKEISYHIASSKVFVNSVQKDSCSYNLKCGDIVSVRGHGRFTFNEELRTTKKGRIVISVTEFK